MTKIAFITAMSSEFNAVHSQYNFVDEEKVSKANVYGHEILLIKSGIGKVHGALAADFACRLGAELVVTTGLAGGIDSSLNQGDIVLAEKVCYHDVWGGEPLAKGQVPDMPLYYETEQSLISTVQKKVLQGYFHYGLTVTGDQFLTDVTRLKEIKQDFPSALAVDMESAAIAQTCYLNHTPFMSLRIISDVVGKENQVEQYDSFWQNVPQKASSMVDELLKALANR